MKKSIRLLLLTMLLCIAVVGCAPESDGDGGGAASPPSDDTPDVIEGDYIFMPSTEVQLVYNGDVMSNEAVKNIYFKLTSLLSAPVVIATEEGPEAEHEIVIGETTRAVSREAYRRLGLLERESSDYQGYFIYSDGNSVAIAYDVDIFNLKISERRAMDYFAENHLQSDRLVLNKGNVKYELIDIVKYQKEKDEALVNEKWEEAEKSLESQVGAELAEQIISAMKSCYGIFTDDIIDWFANLYDPIAGGYYYSNSGRDTVGYGPDLESTYQALAFINGTGMGEDIDRKNGDDVIPQWMCQQILKFAMSLQDPLSGYFYHPQWGGDSFDDRRQLIDTGYISRRGRDLKWALSLISRFGGKPTYDIPTMGVVGSGLLYDGSPAKVSLTSRLSHGDKISAVSLVVAANSTVPAHLQSVENLTSYLNKLDVNGDSYYVGNLLESQTSQILARDKVLDPSGRTTPLATTVKEFFDAHQNQENGAWTLADEIDYESINGILKISGVYNGIEKEFPNPIKAINTAMAGITMEETPTTVCFVLNPWYAITMLIQNVERYNSSQNKAEIEAAIEEAREQILKNAVNLIDVTKEKSIKFKKNDGSFSYFPNTSGPNSQGLPVAVPESVEGDVNATYMFVSGIPNHIFGLLGCDIVPIYTTSDRMNYWNILYDLGDIIKDDVEELVPEDYENETVGQLPSGVTVETGVGSSCSIVNTMGTNGKTTKALALTTISGNTDIMRLSLNNYMPFYNAVVFETDIKIESASGSGQFEMLPYGSPGDAYRIILDYSEEGNVTARTVNDFKQTLIGKEGEWIHIRLEYSYADIDYDRNGTKDLQVRLYAGGKLVAQGINPPGAEPISHSSVSGVRFFSWTASNATLFIDNLLFYQDKVELDPPPVVNEEDEAEIITFEQSTNENIPGKIGISDVSETGRVTVENLGTAQEPNKALVLYSPQNSTDTLKLFLTKKIDVYNGIAFETDLMIKSETSGGEIELYFTTAYNSTAMRLVITYDDSKVFIKKLNSQGEVELTEEIGSLDQFITLRAEYYMDGEGANTRIYLENTLVSESNLEYYGFHAGENVNLIKFIVKDNADATIYIDNFSFAQILTLREGQADNTGLYFEGGEIADGDGVLNLELSEDATAAIVDDVRDGRLTKALRIESPKDSFDKIIFKFINENLESTNTVAFEGDFKITNADGGNILTLYYLTESGEIAGKIVFGWSAGTGNIFVLNMYNTKDGTAKNFDTVVVPEGMGAYFNMRIEYTKISDTQIRIGFYINGEKIEGIDEVNPYDTTAIDADLITEVKIETYQSRKTTLFIDNLLVERTNIDLGGSSEPEEEPDAPTPPTPPTPSEKPDEEYGGSIYDQEDENSNSSSNNWT